jgi:hypothetical protein
MIRLAVQKLAASPVLPLKSRFKSELLHHGVDWQQDVNYLRDTYMEIFNLWETIQPIADEKYDPEQDKALYERTEPLLRELILGMEGVSQQLSKRTDVYRSAENAKHDFETATSYARVGDHAMATLYQSYALMKINRLLEDLTREVNTQARRASIKLGYGYDISGEQFEQGGTSGNDRHLWDTGNSPKRNHTQNNPFNMMIDSEAESDYPELAKFKHKRVYWPPRIR